MNTESKVSRAIDHLAYAVPPKELDDVAVTWARRLDSIALPRLSLPRLGTVNRIVPLKGGSYIEVVTLLDAARPEATYVSKSIANSLMMGGGWYSWVVKVSDITFEEGRLNEKAVSGGRNNHSDEWVGWQIIAPSQNLNEEIRPLLVEWNDDKQHPSNYAPVGAASLDKVRLTGDLKTVRDWIGEPLPDCIEVADIGNSFDKLISVEFLTSDGVQVRDL